MGLATKNGRIGAQTWTAERRVQIHTEASLHWPWALLSAWGRRSALQPTCNHPQQQLPWWGHVCVLAALVLNQLPVTNRNEAVKDGHEYGSLPATWETPMKLLAWGWPWSFVE